MKGIISVPMKLFHKIVGNTNISSIGDGTCTGAINTLNGNLSNKQNSTDNSLNTTSKTVVGGINELNSSLSDKQNSTDNSLNTTSKTIVGGINELKSQIKVYGAGTHTINNMFYPGVISVTRVTTDIYMTHFFLPINVESGITTCTVSTSSLTVHTQAESLVVAYSEYTAPIAQSINENGIEFLFNLPTTVTPTGNLAIVAGSITFTLS